MSKQSRGELSTEPPATEAVQCRSEIYNSLYVLTTTTHDLLNHRVSDGSQAGPDPAWMARPMLFVSSITCTQSAPQLRDLSFHQVADPAERVSEGDSLHAVGVRKREAHLREVRS